jgi:hypothetical protein
MGVTLWLVCDIGCVSIGVCDGVCVKGAGRPDLCMYRWQVHIHVCCWPPGSHNNMQELKGLQIAFAGNISSCIHREGG